MSKGFLYFLTLSVLIEANYCYVVEFGIKELQRDRRNVAFNSDGDINDIKRSGCPSDDHACDNVTAVPPELTFITKYNFYKKYTHAYGIPIVSSDKVDDKALKRACYVVRVLLADNPVIRFYFYKNFGRAGIMDSKEVTTDIPEHKGHGDYWNKRARGLGGDLNTPISTGAEENLLCWEDDWYNHADIFLHEFAHGVYNVGILGGALPSYDTRFKAAYKSAKEKGLWKGEYAIVSYGEYFAQGLQSYFSSFKYDKPPKGIANLTDTREKLKAYDPSLYQLLKEIYPCQNILKNRCDNSTKYFPVTMDCDPRGRGKLDPLGLPAGCVDKSKNCRYWAENGECSKNPGYMKTNCCRACYSYT